MSTTVITVTNPVTTVTESATQTVINTTQVNTVISEQVTGAQGPKGDIGPQGLSNGFVKLSTLTFTASTSVVLDNIFTTTYRDYLVKINVTAVSALTALSTQFRSAGTTLSGSNYLQVSANLSTAYTATTTTGTNIPLTGAGIMTYFQNKLEVFAPKTTNITGYRSEGASIYTANRLTLNAGQYNLTTSIDGIVLSFGAANGTGTIEVWGYA